jgi:diguanylate cyclase (GGDEF)-like protein
MDRRVSYLLRQLSWEPILSLTPSILFDQLRSPWMPHGWTRVSRILRSRFATRLMEVSFVVLLLAARVAARTGAYTDTAGYACFALGLFACAAGALAQGQLECGRLRLRWTLLSIGLAAAGLGYAVACLQHAHLLGDAVAQPALSLLLNGAEGGLLLAATLWFSGAAATIVWIDLMQAMLFIALRIAITYSSLSWDRLVSNHMLVTQVLAAFLFFTAWAASAGASSRNERRFLRIFSVFLGCRCVGWFLNDQVGYLWRHNPEGSFYDLPTILTFIGFALFLFEDWRRRASAPQRDFALDHPRLFVRSLMPSLLALASFTLALDLFLHAHVAGCVALLCSVACYLGRTLLLQSQAACETAALRMRNEHLETLSHCDPLTGVGNRRSLAQAFDATRAAAAPALPVFSLLLIDLDFFKQINDSLGHLQGDGALISVAGVLQEVSAEIAGSHCARFGGDEFALLLPCVEDRRCAALAEAVRARIAALNHFSQGEDHRALSVSVGGAISATDALDAMIARADEALYRSKLQGRNRVSIATDTPVEEQVAAYLPAAALLGPAFESQPQT